MKEIDRQSKANSKNTEKTHDIVCKGQLSEKQSPDQEVKKQTCLLSL